MKPGGLVRVTTKSAGQLAKGTTHSDKAKHCLFPCNAFLCLQQRKALQVGLWTCGQIAFLWGQFGHKFTTQPRNLVRSGGLAAPRRLHDGHDHAVHGQGVSLRKSPCLMPRRRSTRLFFLVTKRSCWYCFFLQDHTHAKSHQLGPGRLNQPARWCRDAVHCQFQIFILVLGTIHVKMLSFVFARPGTRYKSSISVHGTYA